jgi:hypothetical protein
MTRSVIALALSGLLTPFLVGCGDSYGGRCAVSGTITLKGKNLDEGAIVFIPVDPALPTQASAGITKGAYQIPRPQGLVPGKYRVSISSPDGKTPEASDGPPGPSGNFASKDRIPAKFNIESTLEFEVKKDGPNKFDFAIP